MNRRFVGKREQTLYFNNRLFRYFCCSQTRSTAACTAGLGTATKTRSRATSSPMTGTSPTTRTAASLKAAKSSPSVNRTHASLKVVKPCSSVNRTDASVAQTSAILGGLSFAWTCADWKVLFTWTYRLLIGQSSAWFILFYWVVSCSHKRRTSRRQFFRTNICTCAWAALGMRVCWVDRPFLEITKLRLKAFPKKRHKCSPSADYIWLSSAKISHMGAPVPQHGEGNDFDWRSPQHADRYEFSRPCWWAWPRNLHYLCDW